MQKLTALTRLVAGQKPRGHCTGGGGAQFEVLGTARADSGVPGPVRKLGHLVLRFLGTLNDTGCHRRAENGVGTHGLDLV